MRTNLHLPRRTAAISNQAENEATAAAAAHQHAGGERDLGLVENVDALDRWNADQARRSRRWRDVLMGISHEPIPSYRAPVEPPTPGVVGICCSGGGIRSAAFNLGALQALQTRDELVKARYLAAVSGGSYIAAAFAMVAKTWRGASRPKVDPDDDCNGHDDSNPDLFGPGGQPPFAPGSPEEQYLRNRSSYLAPSAMDKLYLASRIVVGVIFNFTFLALPLFGIAVLFAGLVYPFAFPQLTGACGAHCSAALPLSMWVVPLASLGIGMALGLLALLRRITLDDRRQLIEVWSTRLIVLSVFIAWFTAGMPALVALFTASGSTSPHSGTSVGAVGGGGLAALLAGVAAHLTEMLRSPGKTIDAVSQGRQRLAKLSSAARRALAYIVAAVVGPALLLAVMVFGAAVALADSASKSIDLVLVLVGGALPLIVFAAVYSVVDLTSWSLHPFYKRRLCTAFALKRIRPTDLDEGENGYGQEKLRQETKLGLAAERDFDTPVPLSKTAIDHREWPTLIVCAAANVSDPGATPPGRHVTSFTFSAHAIGGPLIGGVPTREFELSFDDGKRLRRRDLTLPAAVAMSGAAVSPSMGKMTRRPLTFLLALANIRLGVWIPNPRWVRHKEEQRRLQAEAEPRRRDRAVARVRSTQRRLSGRPEPDSGGRARATLLDRAHGRARPSYLLRELIGRNRVDAKYLYVTDGGHYENLGLVELLRRGCTEIYCFDASGGYGFEELGDAVALARSELGVEIVIDPSSMVPAGSQLVATANAVTATITYAPEATGTPGVTGTLVYARNVMTDNVPWDVKAYHQSDPRFPRDPTADQLYTDQKFEAYRALGFCAGERAVELMRPAPAPPPSLSPSPPPSPPARRGPALRRRVRWTRIRGARARAGAAAGMAGAAVGMADDQAGTAVGMVTDQAGGQAAVAGGQAAVAGDQPPGPPGSASRSRSSRSAHSSSGSSENAASSIP